MTTQDIQARGEALVAAARDKDAKAAHRHTDFFVFGRHIDEGIPYWERAVEAGDIWSHYTLARYRKVRGDRDAAEALYRAVAEFDAGSAYGLGVLLREDDRNDEAAEWLRHGWEYGRHLDCKIELGKLMAAEGRCAEASAFLMSDVELGDIAVFRWSKLFDSFVEVFDRVAADLDIAEADGDGEAAAKAVRGLVELNEHFADYPGIATEAGELYRRASGISAEAGMYYALFLTDTGREECFPEAVELFLRAREAGVAQAARLLGNKFEQRGHLAEAERAHLLAVEAGEEASQWNLGMLCLRLGRYDEAEHWFGHFGEDPEAVQQLARIAALREGGPRAADEPDFLLLAGVRERAEAGDAEAGYEYADMLNDWGGKNARHLLPWMESAARAGNSDAAYDVAQLYTRLRRFTDRDKWHRLAAEGGDRHSCHHMGWLSDFHHDYQESERWYARAAGLGSRLDSMLAGKLMVQRGAYAEAEPYLRTAWEEGDENDAFRTETAGYYGVALRHLGRLAEAMELLTIAAETWDEDVLSRYDRDDLDLQARMISPEDELEALDEALDAELDAEPADEDEE
ncbi:MULTISPECIES: sel1 repeat family protein [unclassified Streptomyces]|uniref:sel1 repeat family protein n=1 Tax=unclassified Streptomyces TaxID=2593676 RepID=UPI002ED07066|nr:sel1 repeat family protein [Streptomyces sp. NBC_00891]WSY05932.1 sel1 repeat family protein [Streptomyces sp. NBC_00890]WSZ07556.1 sel1 repeat family protein [Streptomyces sp. NBC_00869]WSZ24945.1 sel1 repeat family protein [Streptomyces sp. NBC_00870]